VQLHRGQECPRHTGSGLPGRLKQEPGKKILVGGVAIPSQFIELGLVDEYRLWFTRSLQEKGDGC
jgi:dihydrofolate reductase